MIKIFGQDKNKSYLKLIYSKIEFEKNRKHMLVLILLPSNHQIKS